MKKLTLKKLALLCALLGTLTSCSKTEDINHPTPCSQSHFYYYQNEKHPIDSLLLYDRVVVGFSAATTNEDIVSYINGNADFMPISSADVLKPTNYDYTLALPRLKKDTGCDEIAAILSRAKSSSLVRFANYCYKGTFCIGFHCSEFMFYTDEFLVKVRDENDLSDLQSVANQTNTTIKEQVLFMPSWFVLSATKESNGNALEMANFFHETGLFASCEPNFFEYGMKDESYNTKNQLLPRSIPSEKE